MSGASFGFPPSTGCLVRRTPVLWDPRGKRDPLQDVLNFPVWLFTISPDLNNDLSLRWERIMNHSFAFKTLIKKAQFCFHVLWWWLNYSKTAKTTSHFEVWLTSDCNVKATVAAMSMGEEREGAGREKKSRGLRSSFWFHFPLNWLSDLRHSPSPLWPCFLLKECRWSLSEPVHWRVINYVQLLTVEGNRPTCLHKWQHCGCVWYSELLSFGSETE